MLEANWRGKAESKEANLKLELGRQIKHKNITKKKPRWVVLIITEFLNKLLWNKFAEKYHSILIYTSKNMQLNWILLLLNYFFMMNLVTDSVLSRKPALVEHLFVLCLKHFLWTVQKKYFGCPFFPRKCFQSMPLSMFCLLWVSWIQGCYWTYFFRFFFSRWSNNFDVFEMYFSVLTGFTLSIF